MKKKDGGRQRKIEKEGDREKESSDCKKKRKKLREEKSWKAIERDIKRLGWRKLERERRGGREREGGNHREKVGKTERECGKNRKR